MNGASPPGSLPEGVSSDGCSGPMIYSQSFIGSEIFERLRSSGYTPSVSHSLDSSLREGAGKGCPPFNVPPGNRDVSGDFHRPYEAQNGLRSTVHRGTLPQSASLTAPSEREPGMGAHHSTCRPEAGTWRAIFIAPTKLRMFYIPPFNRVLAKPWGGGRFSSPLRNSEWGTFQRSLGVCCGYGISIQFNLNTKM